METLAERIARDGPVSELDAIGWAIRLAKRLEALHALGVAHGSVSPACVIAAGQDRNARAYLADVQHTSPTPAYQSPERILGGDISMADDVWALAATLYALLTGQSPFTAGSEAEVRQKILAASPPPLAVYDVGDDDLQHILDHAFAREMPQRTASVTAFRRALEEWHPDRGVANLPPLEDEDSTDDDDEGARTMLVRESAGYLQQIGIGVGPGQAPAPAAPRPAAPGPGAGAPAGPVGQGRIPAQTILGQGPMAPPMVAPPVGPPPPALGGPAPRPDVPKLHEEALDDDDDNVRTVMRSMPKDDLAAIIARASGPAGGPPRPRRHRRAARRAAPGDPPARRVPRPVPRRPGARASGPARSAAPGRRPASTRGGRSPAGPGPGAFRRPRGACGFPGQPAPPAGAFAGAAAAPAAAFPAHAVAMGRGPPYPPAQPAPGAPIPQIADDDSEDEDIRTVMRTPEQIIQEEESHDAPRTVLLRDDNPWAPGRPLPAAGNPAPDAPSGRPWPDGPAPAPTMALPAHYEPAAPNFAHSRGFAPPAAGSPAEPMIQGAQGTQKLPPAGVLLASGINVGPSFGAQVGPGPGGLLPKTLGLPGGPEVNVAPGGVFAPPTPPPHQQVLAGLSPVGAAGPRVLGAAPPTDLQPPPDSRLGQASKKGLVLAALIALLIAAGATFAFLKLKGL